MFKNAIIRYGEQPASEFLAHPHNPRKHPDKQRKLVNASLKRFGWVAPVVVNVTTGYVIDGHERVWQALSAGDDTLVPFVEVQVPTELEAELIAVFDRITYEAEYDPVNLQLLMEQVNTDDEVLAKLFADMKEEYIPLSDEPLPDNPPSMDKAEELKQKWQTERGQLWIIPTKHGEHRLLCGDSTLKADVDRVMGGDKAELVLTDPPYGQNQDGVPNDEPSKLNAIIEAVVACLPVMNAVVCAFQSPRTFPVWLDAIRSNGHVFERMLWMYKAAQMSFPWRGWILKSESILISTVGKGDWQDVHPYNHDCYYMPEVSGELPDDIGWHGSVKPLHVVKDILQRTVKRKGIVYDPFGGSGTTMVACEQTGRLCRMIEIEPKYVAVILERMATLGLEPRLA